MTLRRKLFFRWRDEKNGIAITPVEKLCRRYSSDMYLTRTCAKLVSCSWSFTCSKYPVYPRYRVTAIESSTPSGRVERESPTDADRMRFSSSGRSREPLCSTLSRFLSLTTTIWVRDTSYDSPEHRSENLRYLPTHQTHNIFSRELKVEVLRDRFHKNSDHQESLASFAFHIYIFSTALEIL